MFKASESPGKISRDGEVLWGLGAGKNPSKTQKKCIKIAKKCKKVKEITKFSEIPGKWSASVLELTKSRVKELL